jgi:hypothetical protein
MWQPSFRVSRQKVVIEAAKKWEEAYVDHRTMRTADTVYQTVDKEFEDPEGQGDQDPNLQLRFTTPRVA